MATNKKPIETQKEIFLPCLLILMIKQCMKYTYGKHGHLFQSHLQPDIDYPSFDRPFQDAVRAGSGNIMCSYQRVNNSYGCSNSKTLNGLLKTELGFQVRKYLSSSSLFFLLYSFFTPCYHYGNTDQRFESRGLLFLTGALSTQELLLQKLVWMWPCLEPTVSGVTILLKL